MGGVAAPIKVQGSNFVTQNKQDNQAPHPTGQCRGKFFFGPYFSVGGPTHGFVHGFAHGFRAWWFSALGIL